MSNPLFSKKMSVKIDSSTIGYATDFSLSVNKDMIDIAVLSSTGAKQVVPDMYGYTLSGSGMVVREIGKTAGDYNIPEVAANLISTNDASLLWTLLPNASTNKYFEGVGYFSSFTYAGGVGSAMTFDFEIAGDGVIYIKTTG